MPFSTVSAALLLCTLALPVSIAGTNIALALLAAALLSRARTDGARMLASWRREPALAALILYAAIGLATAALSGAPAASLRDAVKDLHRLWSLGLFIAALALEPETPMLRGLAASFTIVSVVGICQPFSGGIHAHMMTRAHGFVHPVVFGEQMAVAVLGTACLLLRGKFASPRERRLTVLFGVLAFGALVLSQTRMALIASGAGLAFVALLEPRARRWFLPGLLLFAVVAGAWEVIPDGGRTLSNVFRSYDPHNPHQARFGLWEAAWEMFRDHPLHGVGPSGYARLFPRYHPLPLDGEEHWGSAHNQYLQHLAERGVLGITALLILFGALLGRAARAVRRSADWKALWAASSMIALLLMCLTETSFQNEQFSALFLLVWAFGTAGLRDHAG